MGGRLRGLNPRIANNPVCVCDCVWFCCGGRFGTTEKDVINVHHRSPLCRLTAIERRPLECDASAGCRFGFVTTQ